MDKARSSLILFAATLIAATVSPQAGAQETAAGAPFGQRAQNVIVLDELFGFYRVTTLTPDAANSDEQGGYAFGGFPGSQYGLTRFGYHRFIAPDLSLGTGLHYASYDIDIGFGVGKTTMLGVSPRVGFVFGGSTTGAWWFRVGGQYYHYDNGNDHSAYLLGPGAELFYVWTPHPHFGVMVGPTVELGLAGSIDQGSGQVCAGTGCVSNKTSTAYRSRVFGLGLGFLFDL